MRHHKKPARVADAKFTTAVKAIRRAAVLAGQGGVCAYCLRPLRAADATADHVRALSRGGADDPSNVVAACRKCNEEKDDQDWTPRIPPWSKK